MTFANPAFAILATAALIASLALSAYFYMGRKNALARFASPQILPKLSSSTSKVKIFSKAALFALGISAALLALARPQWGYKWEEVKQKGVDIIFAVDTSKSMMAEDVKPNRLERAKLAISDVIERLGGDRIGLVAFSGQAFLQCPITLDYDAFKMSLEALDTNIIQRGGTNIAAAIEEAEGAFSSSKNQKILILISDGEELEQSGVSAAERAAKEKGMKIYTLGVGGAGGEAIPVRGKYGKIDFLRDESGKPVSSRLNEDLLKKVAAAAGGIYANLSEDGMEAIYEEGLKKAPKSEISSRMKKLAIERFQIPLAAAIALLALEFFLGTRRTFGRRGASFAIALLAVPAFLAPENAFAQGGQQEKPKAEAAAPSEKTSEPKNWREYFNAGVDCAQKSDANAARENFFKAIALSANDIPVHAKSYYNIGCADYNAAKKSFEKIEIQEAAQKAQNASLQAQGAIQSSSQVLQKGLETLKNSGEEALKDQGLQNEIKGEISKCGQAKKLLPEAEKDIQKIRGEIKNASAQTLSAQKNFENAAELAPEMQSASRNLSAAKNAVKSMSNFDSEFKKSAEGFGELNKALERNIEELKKLLRDDNKDNQQNQDNQNQQDNQDNKQNQNQQDNQNNQNNQQSKDNQNSQNQKSDSSQQNQQNQDKQDSSRENGQENQQQNQKENSDKNKESSPQDRQQSGDENKNRGDENKQKPQNENGESQKSKDQGDLKKQNEQAAKPENENKTGESSARQEHAAEKKDEAAAMPEKSAQEAAAQKDAQAAAEEAKAQESPDYRAQAGVMTRREASQVLDSMKEGEKKLPFSGYGNQRSRFEEKNYKDW